MGKKFLGVIPPIITPIDEQERVDEKAFRKLIRRCIESGIPAIFVAGSNGECMALTQRERDRAIQIALDECRDEIPILAGVMDSSTIRVIENVKRLEQMGGMTAVITPVFYARHSTQQESIRHFEEVAAHTEADLMIYNMPLYTGQKLTPETIFEIAKIDKVIGYKDTTGSMADFIKCLRHFAGTDFMLFQGATNLAIPSLMMGADGYVPSLAPLFPKPHLELYRAAERDDKQAILYWGGVVDEICRIFGMAKSQTSATKYAVSKLGFLSPAVIRPTEPLTEEEKKKIDAHVEKFKEYL